MVLRPNTASFIPGTGVQLSSPSSPPPSSSPSSSKPSSAASAVATSGAVIPASHSHNRGFCNNSNSNSNSSNNNNSNRNFPKGSRGRRGQTQRKTERKDRLVHEALSADPLIQSDISGPMNRRGQISLNHLLNFSIAPREYHHISPHSRKAPAYGLGSGHHPADKARFIQANHRFVVHPNGDYRAQSTDPDVPIPWDSILQILVSPQNVMACPICLSEVPVAPRMAKCGHTACLPCFMRYFASEDVSTGLRGSSFKFRNCPICWDSIQVSEIKPVRWYSIDQGLDEENVLVASEPREGFDVALRLYMRKPGTTLVLPRDDFMPLSQTAVLPEGDVPWHYVPEILHYAWIVKGSEDYMKAECQREIEDLEKMQREDESSFGEDPLWTQRAIQRVHNISTSYADIGQGPHQPSQSVPPSPKPGSSHPVPSRETPYFFYQPRSASHYYLSSLDIRILKRAFGDYPKFPSAILARVEHITSPQPVDDDFRKRIKYLNHLPSGTQISFLECDWSEIVGGEVLEQFSAEIEKRRRVRKEKMIREEKAREQEERNHSHKRHARRSVAVEDDVIASHDSEDVTWVIANAVAGMPAEKRAEADPGISSSQRNLAGKVGTTVWGTPRVTPIATPAPVDLPSPTDHRIDGDEPGQSGGMWTQNWEEILNSNRSDSSKNTPRRKKGKKLVLMSNSVQRGT